MSLQDPICGHPVEWDTCPGCGQPFAAQYRTFEAFECAGCEEANFESARGSFR
jgi:hypothetical protein